MTSKSKEKEEYSSPTILFSDNDNYNDEDDDESKSSEEKDLKKKNFILPQIQAKNNIKEVDIPIEKSNAGAPTELFPFFVEERKSKATLRKNSPLANNSSMREKCYKNISNSIMDLLEHYEKILHDSMENSMSTLMTNEGNLSPISEICRRQAQYKIIINDNNINQNDKSRILKCINAAIKKETKKAEEKYY